MLYLDRLKYSLAASVLVHVVVLLAAGTRMDSDAIGVTPDPEPIVLNLVPQTDPEETVEEPEPDQEHFRLVDPGAAADEPIDDTELRSSHDTKALSREPSEGDPDKPAVDRIDDFEELARRPAPQPPSPPQPPIAPQPAPTPPEPEPRPRSMPEPVPEEVPDERGALEVASEPEEPQKTEPGIAPEPEPEPEETKKHLDEPEQKEPTQLAQAAPPLQQELKASRGREQGGAEPGGFSSFEAKRHELGEYMLQVRDHVEREWRTALATRYAGVGPARAVLACSIRPDGTLAYVRIVDSGQSPGFATLCKAAVERASRHFPPFPFEVPDIYRSKNLEVRWQFTYM